MAIISCLNCTSYTTKHQKEMRWTMRFANMYEYYPSLILIYKYYITSCNKNIHQLIDRWKYIYIDNDDDDD
jgi:hypothetical protein